MSYFMTAYPPAFTAYTGPGDITSFTAWYGLRAYSAAYAASGGNAVDLKRVSDNATMTATFLANGDLDTATISAWIGASSAVVTKYYDQVGTRHMSDNTNPPALSLTGAGTNSRPYMQCGANTNVLTAGSFTPATGVSSLSIVAYKNRASGVGASIYFYTDGTARMQIGAPGNTNGQWRLISNISGGITVSSGAADNAFHYAQGVFNGASSSLRVGGSTTTGSIGSTTTAGIIGLFSQATGTTLRNCEAGFVDNVAWSSGTQDSLDANQSAYYGL